MIKNILAKYRDHRDEDDLIDDLVERRVIRASHRFLDGGFEYLKTHFPMIFEGIGSDKIRKATDEKKKIKIRTEKYSQLQDLWEQLNQKVLLEYKIENEAIFQNLFVDFLQYSVSSLTRDGLIERQARIDMLEGQAVVSEEISLQHHEITKISTMRYDEFLRQLSENLKINLKTLHRAFVQTAININDSLNGTTVRILKQKFDTYLLYHAMNTFEISYQKVTNTIHPTKLTNQN